MFLILFVFLTSLFAIYHFYWSRRHLPPGPLPYPLIGNVNLMTNKLRPGYALWKDLKEKYGPVFTFWEGSMPLIMVTDWEIIKETFIKDGGNYAGRPTVPMNVELRSGLYGILEATGSLWQSQRRFALHVLRNFGLGKNLMEDRVLTEVRAMIEQVKKGGKVQDLQTNFDAAVGSIINTMLFGYRYDETNIQEFISLKESLNAHFSARSNAFGVLLFMYPWLGNLPYFSGLRKIFHTNMGNLQILFQKQIDEKKKTMNYDNEEYSDYVEAYLKEMKKHEHEPDQGGFTSIQLLNVCLDLWIAGMETTSNTLYWSVLYVALNPEVKKKVYEELDAVIGSDRLITMSDKTELNYVNATINEVQRLANLIPINGPHVTGDTVTIGGYTVPKGTVTVPMISSVMYDENIFPEPEKFDPTRFLDASGKLKKVEELCPFSIGKRQCLGEGLAKMELFLFFANVFNQFRVDLHDKNPSTDKDYGITMRAESYTLNVEKRF